MCGVLFSSSDRLGDEGEQSVMQQLCGWGKEKKKKGKEKERGKR